MSSISLIPGVEFDRVRESVQPEHERLALIADMCRFNCLSAVKKAGSGHLGSSFSAMDIVVWLYFHRMNTLRVGMSSSDRDVYFSSKGHDVPGQYAVLHAAGVLSQEKLTKLRRLSGLDGHPDVGIPGIEANSGSLGMGISKAKGMAWAKRAHGDGGHVFVLVGDGELQEGQNYEALMTAVELEIEEMTVIVDHNKFQTDMAVKEITDLRDLEAKFRCFGWAVARCDGHSFAAIERALGELDKTAGKPRVLIADTIKGRGVSFMESPTRPVDGQYFYRWHAGAPDNDSFARASEEIFGRIIGQFNARGLGDPTVDIIGELEVTASTSKEFIAAAFGEALLDIGARRKDVVVLDGDLAADCRVRAFGERYPDRFIENGIAEQDMVSTAGGLARSGFIPIVNSFASFLASRANEQIYNNATERSKVIYVCHFGGLIPAGPGKSHQSIRDVALFSALPHSTILAPCNALETRMSLEYLVEEAPEVGMLRLAIGPSPRRIELPSSYKLTPGRGIELTEGRDSILFGYGPVMLHEALLASEALAKQGFGLTVVNHPWLNRVDEEWLRELVAAHTMIYVLDDHGPNGALGDRILEALAATDSLASRRFRKFAVTGFPACGGPPEVLKHHGLDGASLAESILGERPAAGMAVDEQAYTLEAPQ